jgi:hypothetical protein
MVVLSMVLGGIAVDAITARGDDGSVETVGGAVRLMKTHSNIRMVSETVKARVSPDLVEVDCVFVMKNDGHVDTVLIGFPDGSMGPYLGGGEEQELQSFRSWVDGVEVRCRRVRDVDGAPVSEVGSWWVKRVAFARGAIRTIRDHYTVWPSWHPMLGLRAFRYTLFTGASWKGAIGSAEIVATLDGLPLELVTATEPKARQDGRTFRWSFRDFEPGSADGSPANVGLEWKTTPIGDAEEPDSVRD